MDSFWFSFDFDSLSIYNLWSPVPKEFLFQFMILDLQYWKSFLFRFTILDFQYRKSSFSDLWSLISSVERVSFSDLRSSISSLERVYFPIYDLGSPVSKDFLLISDLLIFSNQYVSKCMQFVRSDCIGIARVESHRSSFLLREMVWALDDFLVCLVEVVGSW